MKTQKTKPENERSLSVEFNLEHVKQVLAASKTLTDQGLVSG